MGRGADGPAGTSGRPTDQPPSIFRPDTQWKPSQRQTSQTPPLNPKAGHSFRLGDINRRLGLCCLTGVNATIFQTGDEELDNIAESTRAALSGPLRKSLGQLLLKTNRKKLMDLYEQDGPPLGSGAFSVVVPVKHRITGRRFAAKVIKVGGPKMEKRVRAALAEAAAHNLLHHQTFVAMFEVFVEREGVCLIMELCPGGTLLSHVQNAVDSRASRATRAVQMEGIYGALSEAEARVVFTRLAAALQYLHDACGMVHRDVKLENVLVEKGGAMDSVRLADFGFTVPTVSAKTKGVVESGLKGTLEYASPEVLVAYLEPGGDASDASRRPPVDMFSLGVTLFIMLGGYHLFDGEFGSKAVDARNAVPVRLDREFSKTFWREVSGEAKDLVRRLLAPSPAVRLTAGQAMTHAWVQQGGARLETSSAPLFALTQLWTRDAARVTMSSPAPWLNNAATPGGPKRGATMARIPNTPLEAESELLQQQAANSRHRREMAVSNGDASVTRDATNTTGSWIGPRTPPRPERLPRSTPERGGGGITRQRSTEQTVGSPQRQGSVASTSRDTATGLGRTSGLEGRADREKPALRSPTSAFQMRRTASQLPTAG